MLRQGGQDLLQEGLRQVSEQPVNRGRVGVPCALLPFRQIHVNPLPPPCCAACDHRGEIPKRGDEEYFLKPGNLCRFYWPFLIEFEHACSGPKSRDR